MTTQMHPVTVEAMWALHALAHPAPDGYRWQLPKAKDLGNGYWSVGPSPELVREAEPDADRKNVDGEGA